MPRETTSKQIIALLLKETTNLTSSPDLLIWKRKVLPSYYIWPYAWHQVGQKQYTKNLTVLGIHDKEVSKESLQSILDQILQKHIFLNWKNNASACKQWIQNVTATAVNH